MPSKRPFRFDSGQLQQFSFEGLHGLTIFADTSGSGLKAILMAKVPHGPRIHGGMTGYKPLNRNNTVSNPASTNEVNEEAVHQARRKGLFWALVNITVIAAVIIGVTRSDWGTTELWPALQNAQWVWLFLGWVLMNLAVFVLGHRWHALLPKSNAVSGSFLGVALSAALLLNYAIPGPFGELAAAWFVSKRSDLSVTQALVAGSTARLIGLLSAAVGAVCLWPLVTLELAPEYSPIFQSLVVGWRQCSACRL